MELRLFDVHTHLQMESFRDDRETVIARMREKKIGGINVGVDEETSAGAILLARKNPSFLYAAVGMHPNEAGKREFVKDRYRRMAQDDAVVAIGECGLDYYRSTERDKGREKRAKEEQKDIFIQHIELAHELHKPLMIHCRNAFPEVIDILLSFRSSRSASMPGVLHFFTGTKKDAKKLLDMNYMFSFGGVITFASEYDEVIRYIPLERIVLETDAPYVAPTPYRGTRNEPAYIEETAKRLAAVKGFAEDEVKRHTTLNARTAFKV